MPVGRGGGGDGRHPHPKLLTPPPLPKGILFSLRSHGKIGDCILNLLARSKNTANGFRFRKINSLLRLIGFKPTSLF